MAKVKESPEVFKAKLLETVNEYFQDSEQNAPSLGLSDIANNVGVNLGVTINEMKSDIYVQKNPKLMGILEQYQSAINQGAYEERLYETFIHSVSPYASYMTGLVMPLKNLKDRIDDSKVEIDLTKILESMLETTSYYIVPLIEENVATYVREKTPNHRVQLMSNLAAFAGDPYVKLMIEAINLDNDKNASCVTENKVFDTKDRIKFIHEHADIKNVYSPIQYLKENQCVFSVNGKFYVKSGVNVSKFDIAREGNILNESFVHLTRCVNDPRVSIDNNAITFAANNKIVVINENGVEINGKKEDLKTFENLNTLAMIYEDYDLNFWSEAKLLAENFNNIADVNFAKHVELYDNKNISFDIMKISESLYVVTHNNILNEHIFYKNVNPIQCRNIINEHMGINVSDLFENLLPNQDLLMKKIYETTNAYEEALNKYSEQLKKLNSAKDKAEGEEKTKLEKMMSEIEHKQKDLENEYKEFQNKSKDLVTKTEDEDEENKKIEKNDEPIKSSEVDDVKDELSRPINSDEPETSNLENLESDDDLENVDGIVSDEEMNAAIADVIHSDYNDDVDVENPTKNIEDEKIYLKHEDAVEDAAYDYDFDETLQEEPELSIEEKSKDDKQTRVIDIVFHQNILVNTVQRSGVAYVSIPLLDGQGNLTKDIKLFNFNVSSDGIITMENNEEEIPYDLYNIVVNAIESHPDYDSMVDTEASKIEETPVDDEELPEDITAEIGDEDEELPNDINIDDVDEISFDEFVDKSEEPNKDSVKTYVKDDTEIEMLADNKDESKIKESANVNIKSHSLNEKTNQMIFDDDNVEELEDEEDIPEVEEEESALTSDEMMDVMSTSFNAALEVAADDDIEIEVSKPESLDIKLEDEEETVVTVDYFTVAGFEELEESEGEDEELAYVVYKIDDEFYSRPRAEFDDICDSYEGEELVNALKSEYDDLDTPLNPVQPENEDDCIDIMSIVMNAVAGDSYGIEEIASETIEEIKKDKEIDKSSLEDECRYMVESIKIRKKTSVNAEKNSDSKKTAEIEDPTETKEAKEAEKKKDDAEKEVEQKTNEAFKPVLPNQKLAHAQMTTESFHARGEEWFNVNDKVFYKPLKNTVGIIYAIEQDGTYDIILNDGTKVYGVTSAQLEPKDISLKDVGYIDIPQTDISAPKQNLHKDLNKRIDANIVVDGYKMSNESYKVSLADVYSKKQYLRVMNESGIDDRYPRENVEVCEVPTEDWKWAVFTMDSELEPDRKIQVDPCSWNRAAIVCDSDPDCLVKCLKGGEIIELPYKYIKFIA